jgi:hypothetical protein
VLEKAVAGNIMMVEIRLCLAEKEVLGKLSRNAAKDESWSRSLSIGWIQNLP